MNKIKLKIEDTKELKVEITSNEIKISISGEIKNELKFSNTNELTKAIVTLLNVLESDKLDYLCKHSEEPIIFNKKSNKNIYAK